MNDARLTTLIEHTFSRADFAYRIGVLKEFLSFLFFTEKSDTVTNEVIAAFEKKGQPVADIIFLHSLPGSFFEGFTKDSFNDDLDRLTREVERLPTLSLTMPVMLDDENRNAVGAWVCNELGKDVVLDLASDPEIGVGCEIVWNNQLHDFTFDYYLKQNQQKVEESIARVVPRVPSLKDSSS